ncbi:MAG: hypothetical protein L0Z55_09720 [Planctomycetes bacterium]|nr:hypothetical protein [Planctomycetota bacterium]
MDAAPSVAVSRAVPAWQEQPARPAAPGAGESAAPEDAAPPLPDPTFADPANGERYRKAIEHLSQGEHRAANDLFRDLKERVSAPAEKEAVARGLLESEGRLELAEVTRKHGSKEPAGAAAADSVRKAIARLDKLIPRFARTFAGAEIAKHRKGLFESLYHVIADFEPGGAKSSAPPREPGRRPGEGGYGEQAKVVKGSVANGEVREGTSALRWSTGDLLSHVNFEVPAEGLDSFRYLCISLRSEDPKETPRLVVLFDARENFQDWGGGPRRGGAGWVLSRAGFHTVVVPEGTWQDLRIDLKDLTKKGDVTWGEVVALRVVHLPGAAARLVLDDLRLERATPSAPSPAPTP